MAAAIARYILGDTVAVSSAGVETYPGMRAARNAMLVMQERGLDISSHRTRDVRELDVTDFEQIIALDCGVAEKFQRIAAVNQERLTVLNIADPSGYGLGVYRERASEIEAELRRLWL
jgi:protein-tyrosine phosphatase